MSLSLAWSGVMAGGLFIGLVLFIVVVMRAERRSERPAAPLESTPRREVIGGRFDAAGGRQVMPRRDASPATEDQPSAGTGRKR